MAEGDGFVYQEFKRAVLEGELDLGTGGDTLKVILVTGHSPDLANHQFYSDVSGDEESGTGYSAGGETLGSQAVTKAATTKLDGTDVTWSGLDVGTPSHAIMYADLGASTTDILIAYWEVTTASNGGDYTLQWNAAGILTLA